MRRLSLIPALVAVVLSAGCKKDAPPRKEPAAQAPKAEAPKAADPHAVEDPGEQRPVPPGLVDDEPPIKSIYPDNVAPNPLAVTLCNALHALPARRKAECCETKAGLNLTDQCVKMLSAGVADGALTLDKPGVATCIAEAAKRHEGCEWVGLTLPAPPASCRTVFVGKRTAGQSCRSTLECADNQFCRGVGPTQLGACGPQKAEGAICGAGVDPLASFTRIRDDQLPTECDGFCDKNRCRPWRDAGAQCKATVHCKRPLLCKSGVCAAGGPQKIGQPCTGGGCVEGARCHQSVCIRPKPSGATCTSHFECLGACYGGTCDKMCRPITPIAPPTSSKK